MRTTINVDEDLLAEAKEVAARSGMSLSALVGDALRESLARRRETAPIPPLTLPVFRGKPLPAVDLDDTASLVDVMDGRRDPG